jgi:hypothetical protein
MSLVRPSLIKVTTVCVVLFAFWLGGAGKAEAGCGDHGYVVQRANGDVVVVTPSQPTCPCKGPQCRQSDNPPSAPVSPAQSPTSGDDAWRGDALLGFSDTCLFVPDLDPLQFSGAGPVFEILQPPRV